MDNADGGVLRSIKARVCTKVELIEGPCLSSRGVRGGGVKNGDKVVSSDCEFFKGQLIYSSAFALVIAT